MSATAKPANHQHAFGSSWQFFLVIQPAKKTDAAGKPVNTLLNHPPCFFTRLFSGETLHMHALVQALVEGPDTGVGRQLLPFKRLALTDYKLPIQRNARIGTIRAAAKVKERYLYDMSYVRMYVYELLVLGGCLTLLSFCVRCVCVCMLVKAFVRVCTRVRVSCFFSCKSSAVYAHPVRNCFSIHVGWGTVVGTLLYHESSHEVGKGGQLVYSQVS